MAVTSTPGEVLEVYIYMRGGGGVGMIFWVENLHARYFLGSSDLPHIVLGLKKICVFFWVLSPSELFVLGFALRSVDQKNFNSNLFSATCVPEKPLLNIKSCILGGWKL